ncbi:MAG TPA: hypothetical protein VIB80_03470 [Aquiluna sp.]
MVWTSEKGAVTAEFMLLLPALLVLLTAALGLFQLGLERISLEVQTFEAARAMAIGFEPELREEVTVSHNQDGRFLCVTLVKNGLVDLEATRCMIPYGG